MPNYYFQQDVPIFSIMILAAYFSLSFSRGQIEAVSCSLSNEHSALAEIEKEFKKPY